MGGWEGKEHLRFEISKRKSRIQNRKHELTINHNIVNETARKQKSKPIETIRNQSKPIETIRNSNEAISKSKSKQSSSQIYRRPKKNTKMIGNIRLKQFVNSIK